MQIGKKKKDKKTPYEALLERVLVMEAKQKAQDDEITALKEKVK